MRDKRPIEERISEKFTINNESGCWEWTSNLCARGRYGAIIFKSKTKTASRFIYEMFVEEIPKGLLVCHCCDNTKCINPDHLYLGTTKQNMRDITERGRWPMRKGSSSCLSKLTEKDVLEIRRKYIPWRYGFNQLGKEYGVDGSNISMIVNRKTWTHI